MSTRRPSPLDLDRFLPYRLDILAEGVSRALSRIYYERYGIGVPEWRVLAHLGQYAPITARDIGARSRMHKTKVSRAVGELERLGFVRRMESDTDRREALLSLTAKGRAAYDDLAPRAADFARQLLDDLTTAEQRALDSAIDRLLAKLAR
ncbi:MAG TPA: MarR family transcriptional regulator [Candidatus Cybelea sp.]|nr:MarR family transcriptional regulator [Candidatus Cybelea sp.]